MEDDLFYLRKGVEDGLLYLRIRVCKDSLLPEDKGVKDGLLWRILHGLNLILELAEANARIRRLSDHLHQN